MARSIGTLHFDVEGRFPAGDAESDDGVDGHGCLEMHGVSWEEAQEIPDAVIKTLLDRTDRPARLRTKRRAG